MKTYRTNPFVKQQLLCKFSGFNINGLPLLAILLLFTLHSKAQLTLNSPGTIGTYSDKVSITLTDGFSSTPTGTQELNLFISTSDCDVLATSPSHDHNYIATYTPRVPGIINPDDSTLSTCQVMTSIQYADGLGRPEQTVQVKGSPYGRDIIQPIAYDNTGRETTKYLPYVLGPSSANNGNYQSGALTAQAAFYNPASPGASNIATTAYPSAPMRYELSPLNRVVEQGAPGSDWQLGAHTAGTVYAANDSTSLSSGYWAQKYVVNTDGTYSGGAAYGNAKLSVTVTHDENWTSGDGRLGTTEEYTDKDGHMILRRTFNYNAATSATEALSTYYVYDDIGNLRYVLPPSMNPDSVNATPDVGQANNQGYHYMYDDQQRMIKKTLPGYTTMNMAYNQLDRVVMTSDSVQSNNLQWTATKYDALGRVIMTGLWTAGSALSPAALKTNIYAAAQWDARAPADTVTGYTVSSYPSTLTNILNVNYYDDYNIPHLPTQYDHHTDTVYTSRTEGLLTATKTAILNPDGTVSPNMLWTVYYYDDEGRVIKTYKQHYLGGAGNYNVLNYDEVTNAYNFTNAVTNTTRQHHTAAASGSVKLAITDSLVYDHMGRLTENWNQLNGGIKILLSKTDYNELGQAVTKHLHSTDGGSTFIQDINYAYNERGWLKSNTAPLFSEQLKYNDGTTPQYNGNISQMLYSGTNSGSKTFSYSYDKVNRLTAAASTSSALDESLTYDVIGNINSLSRSGVNNAALAYAYTLGGQLQTITNSSSAFRSYAYDANGNATSDGAGKSINYNLLNLPRTVSDIATYTYDAGGQKLRNAGSDGTWDYDNGIVYHNGAIEFIGTSTGRAVPNGAAYTYQYNIQDHLGNDRVSFYSNSGTPTLLQEDEYYSFGLRKSLYDNSNNNRYLYNGKEVQTDLANQYDYGARFYDPVIARWTTIDPLAEKYRKWSPYNYGVDNPMRYTDPDGMGVNDIIFVVRGTNGAADRTLTYKDGTATWNDTKQKYDGKGANYTVWNTIQQFHKIENGSDATLKNQLNTLENSDEHHFIEAGKDNAVHDLEGSTVGQKQGSQTEFDFSNASKNEFKSVEGVPSSDLSTVTHEMRHMYDNDTGNNKDDQPNNTAKDPSEIRAVNNENRARKMEGLPARTTYGGEKIDPKKLKNPPNNN